MTTFSVVFSHAADADFDDILHYIAKDDPVQAILFVDRLQQRAIDLLFHRPERRNTYRQIPVQRLLRIRRRLCAR